MNDNLLDCVAHGTTYEEFMASFGGDVEAAAKHLREFYEDAMDEAGEDVPTEDLDMLEKETARRLRKYT